LFSLWIALSRLRKRRLYFSTAVSPGRAAFNVFCEPAVHGLPEHLGEPFADP
jgi:hypothetical protein